MHVYRMEHQTFKYGPFIGESPDSISDNERHARGEFFHAFHRKYKTMLNHPNLRVDGLDGADSHREIFGCLSLDHIFHWFGDFLDLLKQAGMAVRIYAVPDEDVRHGKSGLQVTYCADKATLVEEIPL